jgi:hypothetical protein
MGMAEIREFIAWEEVPGELVRGENRQQAGILAMPSGML